MDCSLGSLAARPAAVLGDVLANDLRQPQRARTGIVAVGKHQVEIAPTLAALAQRQIQQYAAELAIDQAARKLVITAETDRLLVQSFARRLTGDDSKGGKN